MFVGSQYECHHWTQEDLDAIADAGLQDDELSTICERHHGFVFTQGDETLALGCGRCWCCKPSNI